MDRQQYERAKSVLTQVRGELARHDLTAEQRAELEKHANALSGALMSPWLPVDWPRRLLMAAIFLLGLQQASVGNYQPFIWWLALPLFSPRIMGELAYFFGRLRGR